MDCFLCCCVAQIGQSTTSQQPTCRVPESMWTFLSRFKIGLGGGNKKKAHLLVIPIDKQGHLIPILRFSTELARKGVIITIALYEDSIAHLSSKGFLSEIHGLDIRFVGLKNPWGPSRNLPSEDSKNLQESFKPVLEKLLRDKGLGIPGPTSFISDSFLIWAQPVLLFVRETDIPMPFRGKILCYKEFLVKNLHTDSSTKGRLAADSKMPIWGPRDLSERLEIPWYMFIPSGAAMARIMQEAIWLFARNQLREAPDATLMEYKGTVAVPGLPPLHYHELVFPLLKSPSYFLVRCKAMCQAAGVVVNTFYDLEEEVIESIIGPGHPEFEENKVRKVYPVGPLSSTSANLLSTTVVNGVDGTADESIAWLSTQPPSSVLYIAFGSLGKLTTREIHELAMGLESSGQRFLWVLPERNLSTAAGNSSIKGVLPEGFEARVGDRGHIVTGWAPQLQILAHSATGGFLTHAGWNSLLESITIGVPMICWPQGAEQHLNCRYLVDRLKVADQLQTGPNNILDWKEVERAVQLLMIEPEGKEMRRRVEELKRKGAQAVAKGGPMSRAIEEFALDISTPCSH